MILQKIQFLLIALVTMALFQNCSKLDSQKTIIHSLDSDSEGDAFQNEFTQASLEVPIGVKANVLDDGSIEWQCTAVPCRLLRRRP